MTTASPANAAAVAEPAPRRRGPPRLVEVLSVQTLSPLMRRITFGGASLAGFSTPQPAGYIKLIFPEPGQTEPPPFNPDGPRPTSMRTYTPRRFDPQALTIEVDFVLHGEGPAGLWAAQAAAGQRLLMMGPGPGYTPDANASEFMLIGDDSALPAIEMILESLPAGARATVVVEVVDAAEERPLPGAAHTTLHWAHRGNDAHSTGDAALHVLERLPPPAPTTQVYIACEAGAMRRIRQWAAEHWPVPRPQTVGRGYWKLGNVNHPDHDYGADA